MKIGDLVWFACDTERYQQRMGVYLGKHDNLADTSDTVFAKSLNRAGRSRPRQVADILYQGKHVRCWYHHVHAVNRTTEVINENR